MACMPRSSSRTGRLIDLSSQMAIASAISNATTSAPATNLSALKVSVVASATRCRVRFRSIVALTPSELSTAAIAGRVRC